MITCNSQWLHQCNQCAPNIAITVSYYGNFVWPRLLPNGWDAWLRQVYRNTAFSVLMINKIRPYNNYTRVIILSYIRPHLSYFQINQLYSRRARNREKAVWERVYRSRPQYLDSTGKQYEVWCEGRRLTLQVIAMGLLSSNKNRRGVRVGVTHF